MTLIDWKLHLNCFDMSSRFFPHRIPTSANLQSIKIQSMLYLPNSKRKPGKLIALVWGARRTGDRGVIQLCAESRGTIYGEALSKVSIE